MEIKQIILADYSNVSREGKLNVLGIFSNLSAAAFPVVHPQMHLVIVWEASKTEAGKSKRLDVQMLDADGKVLLGFGGELLIPDGRPGHKIRGNFILPLFGIKFDKPGQYAFHVLINNDDKGSTDFEVLQRKIAK